MSARLPGVLASLAALGLLAVCAPAGWPALGAGLALGAALLGGVRAPRRWRLPLDVLAGVGLLLAAWGGPQANGLAALARFLALASLALQLRAPAMSPALHAAPTLVAVWTCAALGGRPSPPLALAALATLGAGAWVLARGRSQELREGATRSRAAGLAAAPWGEPRAFPFAAALAAALTPPLLLLAAGARLPHPLARPARVGPSGAPAAGSQERGGRAPLGFSSALDLSGPRPPLADDERIVARVAVDPELPALYLRGVALEEVRAEGFFARPLPEPPLELLQPFERLLEVELLRPQEGWLPHLGQVLAWEGADARWSSAGLAQGEGPRPALYRLRVVQAHPRFLVAGLPAAEVALPPLPAALAGGPASWASPPAEPARERPLLRARQLAQELTARCRYDPDRGRAGGGLAAVVEEFLARGHGVCQEFAATLVLALRREGVPARLVQGWRTLERDEEGRFVVRGRHAHAWAELALEGAGWVALDPTPDGVVAGGAASGPEAGPAAAGPASLPRAGGAGAAAGAGKPGTPWALGALLAALLAGAVALAGGRGQRRRVERRRLGAAPPAVAPGARERLLALLEAAGWELGGAETPWAFARERLPEGDPLRLAVERYTALRFSGRQGPGAGQPFLEALRAAEDRSGR